MDSTQLLSAPLCRQQRQIGGKGTALKRDSFFFLQRTLERRDEQVTATATASYQYQENVSPSFENNGNGGRSATAADNNINGGSTGRAFSSKINKVKDKRFEDMYNA